MIELHELHSSNAGDYSAMTFPAYRHLVGKDSVELFTGEASHKRVYPLAIGAQDGDVPVGLALGCVAASGEHPPRLLSVFVKPDYRRCGVATRLVERCEYTFAALGHPDLEAVYMTGKPGAAIFERLIARRGWVEPEMRMLHIKFSVEEAMSTRWYGKYKLRQGFEVFTWEDLTAEDEAELRRSHSESSWIAEDLVPWKYDRGEYHRASSVGARYEGKVVGWVINHEVSPGLIRFTCSYMHPDFSRRARIVPLYSESIQRMGEDPSIRQCTFTVPRHHEEMGNFLKRWCAPWASFQGETRGTAKRLAVKVAA